MTRHNLCALLLLLTFAISGCVTTPCFTLLVDPGHMPAKPGVTSCSGVPEYRYNNQLARLLVSRLQQQAGVMLLLSRTDEQNLELTERVRDSGSADLVLSLHHDSVQPQFLAEKIVDGEKRLCSDYSRGFSLFVSRKNRQYEQSLDFARRLGRGLVARGLHPNLTHAEPIAGENRLLLDRDLGVYAFDDLIVLKRSEAPALLLEAGVVVNPADEALVQSDEYREAIAEAVRELFEEKK
jgi:N-acetylmuramoyl-L-alanine amidase